jgi:DNA replication protein DnaC
MRTIAKDTRIGLLTSTSPLARRLSISHRAVASSGTAVVTLVDRLVHRSEILTIAGDSYRLKEAQERAARRKPQRATKKSR